MAKLQTKNGQNHSSAWQRIWDSLLGHPERMAVGRKPRRLMIDQLEERQLLSVSPLNLNDVLINQAAGNSQIALSAKAIAGDNNGDFVVTWTRADTTPTGGSDANVYARYYTNAVQRISLPTGATNFMLQYNGNAIDTLSISAGTAPFQDYKNPIIVTISLKYGGTTLPTTISYDETQPLAQNVAEIQAKLRTSGIAELSDVTVGATDAYHFVINYGPNSNAKKSTLAVANIDYDPIVPVASRCFLPAAEVTNTRVPGMTPTSLLIPIIPNDPATTASNIEYALKYGNTYTNNIAPITFPDPSRVDPSLGSPAGPYNNPITESSTTPNVKVTAISATEFEITFTGDAGKQQQPLMTVLNSLSTPTHPILLVGASSWIVKQTSDEFRVNDTETDDPRTLAVDVYDQTNAQVAMDVDGDFVITWQSEVPDSQANGSVSDIYAKLFHPAAYVTQVQKLQVQSTLPLSVDVMTDLGTTSGLVFDGTTDPALAATALNLQKALIAQGYDPDTTRVTAKRTSATTYELYVQWGGKDVGRDISLIATSQPPAVINPVPVIGTTTSYIADMDHNGVAETGIQSVSAANTQFQVNTTTVNAQSSPSVGMDGKGNFTIAWDSEGQNLSFFNQIKAQRYDFNGNPLGYEFQVSNENTSVNFSPYVAVSNDGAIAIGWCNSNDPNQYLHGVRTVGTRAKIFDAHGNVLMNEFSGPGAGIDGIAFDSRDNFVITGSSLTSNDNLGSVGEGDVFAQEWQLYDTNGNVSGIVLRDPFRVSSANFDTGAKDFWPNDQYNSQPAMDADGDLVISFEGYGPDVSETDIDSYIAQQLIAYKASHPGISDYDLGLQRLSLEKRYGLLRGEANGALFSQFDADPTKGQAPSTILTSDDIANNMRDGSNTSFLLAIDRNAVSGGFTLRLYTAQHLGYVDVAVTPVYYENNGTVNPYETLKAIDAALSASGIVGINWPQNGDNTGPFDGSIGVRLLSTTEIAQRIGTAWDPTKYDSSFNISGYVYEVTFMGEMHDTPAWLYVQKNEMKLASDPTAEQQRIVFSQTGATTPTGSFTFTIGGFTSTPIGFNTANMNAVAASMESQLQASHPGAIVTYNTYLSGSSGSPWVFDVTFGGTTDIGIDQPKIYINMDATLAANASDTVLEVIKGHSKDADAQPVSLATQTYADAGTQQSMPSITMSSDGDFVIVWNQYDAGGYYSTFNNLYYRTFQESTDTAGPTVGNAYSSSGDILDQNDQITVDQGLQHIVLSFDEEMQNTAETQTLTFSPTASNGTSLFQLISAATTTIKVNSWVGFPSSGQFKIKVDNEIMLVTGGAGTTNWTVQRGIGTLAASHNQNAKVQSSFVLQIGNLTSVPIWYDSVNLANMNAALQTAIDTIAGGLGGVSVAYMNNLKFRVTFDGNYRGSYVPLIQMVAGDANATFKGTISAAIQYDSVTNPMNYRLLLGSTEVPGSIIHVEYGLNKASDLAASDPTHYGDLDVRATNKWEVVITIDGNGTLAGTPALSSGTYTIQALTPIDPTTANPAGVSGLRDLVGNSLGYTGFTPNGVNFSQQFQLVVGSQGDTSTDPNSGGGGGSSTGSNGFTSPESPGAVAVDADGDHIVTWTAYSDSAKCNRVYFQVYYNDGTHSDIMEVTAGTFPGDAQGYATVACDADGDFVITWTNYRDENGDAPLDGDGDGYVDGQPGVKVREQVDVYAQQFTRANGAIQRVGSAFRVNTYTNNDQLWSNVAMNAEGAFVITWSSMGQEDNGQLGSGYGVYARRYDSFGQALSSEFLVNHTTAGNQQNSSVALAADGGFVIAWQSKAVGGTSDIYVRSYNPDGTPQGGPNLGEFLVNTTTAGDQTHPDVAMNLAGTEFVVVWQGTSMSGSGSDIYSQPFLRESYSSDATIAFWSQLVYQTTTITRVSGTTSSSSTTTTGDPNAPYTNSSIYTSISTRDGDTITISTTSHYGATIGETLVNTTRNGAQLYPSVAVSYNGSYVVTWSGNGDRTNQSDDSGVFYQRFGTDALAAGGEMRANIGTTGDQKNASVAMDASGNFVIAWTGVGSSYGETDIFRHVSLNVTPTVDLVGPIVTDVRLSDGTRIFDGDTIQPASPGVSQLVVVFSEKMYTGTNTDGSPSLHSVLNLQNWQLSRDGNEIDNVIQAISFGLNPLTHKYEAVLTFRNPLAVGNYTMTAMDTMWDAALNLANGGGSYVSNALDGDYDATPGTNATYTGQPGFSIRFTATTSATANAETRVNTSTGYTDEFSTTYASGYAQESSARTVAVDHSGDFAVVWTRYGADGVTDPSSPNYDPNAASNAGVYMRLYDRNNNPLTGEVLVNTFTKGNQINGTIAMDADGDFVVVWASDSQDPDGSWGIYGQRFNSIGQKIDGEFRVNTNTANDQVSPAVAMNSSGAFVVVWATKGEAFGYFNDIHGQIFNRDGQRVGNEFLVNSENIPSNNFVTGGTELHPAVSMNDKGQFIVSWEAVTGQTNGVVTGTEVMMRTFGSDGTPLQFYNDANDDQGSTTKEFIVDGVGDSNGNSDQAVFTARNPQVVLDNNGNFIIVYEYAFDLGDDVFTGPVYGVYYRRGHLDHGSWDTLPTQANQPAFFGDSSLGGPQVNPTVALDANNNFVIAWNGPGATVDPLNSNVVTEVDLQGVFIRRFVSSNVIFSSDIPVTPQTRVNSTSGGDQKFPSVAMTPDGDVIAVWSGNGVGDRNGIYFRRYQQTTDTAGPELTDFLLPDGTPINTNQQVGQALSAIVLTFDEAMFDNATHTGNAVTNPANYKLLKNGVEVVGGISQVYYGLNMANTLSGQYGISSPKTNKYEVVLIVDDNGAGSGVMPLIDGQYQIVAKNSLRDAVGNPLNSTGMNPNGNVMSQSFNVTIGAGQETQVANSTNGGKQTGSQSVAGDADGDHVVVWTNTNSGQQGVYFKLYSVIWTVNTATNTRTASYSESESGEVRITSDVTATGAAVARDADGDFVVTWTAQNGANGTDIFAQQFDAKGVAKSGIFRVNTYTTSAQSAPAVAMGTEGDFVITWESLGQDESGYGIYAQRFDRNGVRLGGTNEIQTINFVDAWTGNFSLLWNDGTTDRATAVINHHGNMAATTAAIKKAMADIGASVDVVVSGSHLNIIFTGKSASVNQSQLRVNPANLVKTGGTTNSARIDISTIQDGDTGEFRVNDTTLSDQTDPSIAMDKSGNFVISWTSSVQNTQGAWNTDIYAKKFTSSGSYWNGNNVSVTNGASPNANLPPNASIGPLISTVDNPTSHQVPSGAGYDGVVQVNFDVLGLYMGYGSGVLLAGSNVILTAAHVATYEGTFIPIESQFMNVTFDTATGPVTMGVSQVIVHPGWLGNLADGNDIALLVLDGDAPSGVKGYDIYRGSDEVGKIGSMYGYGITGTGANGSTGDSNNLKYSGQNRIDATSSIFGSGFSNTFLVSDFDSGLPANDAMGIYYNVHDLGLGVNEAGLSSGDSGGPMFVNGKIAGIASFGMTYGGSQDAVPGLNSSYGEFFGETRVSLFASWIDSITAFAGGEFLVNADDVRTWVFPTDGSGNPIQDAVLVPGEVSDNTSGDQKWSSVGMDDDGDFVITWTSAGHDSSGNGYGASAEGENGVYARRYNSRPTQTDYNLDGIADLTSYAASNAIQINDTTDGDQQRSSVAMDADGDFTVVWESSQSGNFDVFAKRFIRTSEVKYARNNNGEVVGTNPVYGPDGEIGAEFSINSTRGGDQSHPSIAMDEAGDCVVVWSGAGKFDTQGVYLQRFNRPADDTGPIVADVLATQGSALTPVDANSTLESATSRFVITFGEDVSTVGGAGGANSVSNPSNWVLLLNGQVVPGAISKVEYGLNQALASGLMATADGKYEAVVTFKQALGEGSYVLTLKDSVQDVSLNKLDGNFDGVKGSNFTLAFTVISGSEGTSLVTSPGTPKSDATDTLVNTIESGDQITPAVAANATGDYVVVWTTSQTDSGDIMAQRYDRYGRTVGRAFLVSSYQAARDFALQSSTSPGLQTEPTVAMDNFGNFVVVWAGTGADDSYGIYARVFDVNGAALGEEFLVNQFTSNVQDEPAVAMDADGDFVVTWSSYGQGGDVDGVYMRRFNILGQAQTDEVRVNTSTANRQDDTDVAMDAVGNFVVTWVSDSQDGSAAGVYAQRFNAAGAKVGGEFRINQYATDKQDSAKVAMDKSGNFIVTWASFGQDGNGYGVYARRFNASGAAITGEFLVNQITLNWQVSPDVGIDGAGNFMITWSSQRDSNSTTGGLDYGIYARIYNADGSDFVSPSNGQTLREWRVNAQLNGNQINPAISAAQNGQFTVVWAGIDNLANPVTSVSDLSNGVYSRVISLSTSSPLIVIPSGTTIGLVNTTTAKIYLKNSNTAGPADTSFVYGPGGSGWICISGDWDGDGIDSIGLYNAASSTFYLKNNNSNGAADISFVYGPAGSGWTPIVGDWDGNGTDTIGLFNPATSKFYLRNRNDAGVADIAAQYGPSGSGWLPVVGDWDANGTDTIGLYNSTTSKFYLRNTNNAGAADVSFVYGPAGGGWTPIVGDWNADGRDTVGLYNSGTAKFYLRNANAAGAADTTVNYGPGGSNWTPIVGSWVSNHALLAADTATTDDAVESSLTPAELQPIVDEAIARWTAAGLDAATIEKLKQVQFTIGNLSGAYLGKAQADQIYLDNDGAGHGWFVDSTPATDDEFAISDNGNSKAIDPQAVDRIDLLSVVEHELGHVAGLDDLDSIVDGVMNGVLEAGVRRTLAKV